MKSWIVRLLVATVAGLVAVDTRAESTLGLGAAYFRTVDSLNKPFEESGVAPVLSYRADLTDVVKLQLDGLLYPEGYAGAYKDVFSPQAFVLFGGDFYVGAGFGTLIAGSDVADSPMYIARVGYTIRMFTGLHLDLNANYELSDWDGINDVDERKDSDTVTVGAALRLLL